MRLLTNSCSSDLVTGISMRNASIPYYGVKGGSAQLMCDFDIESDKLLNLKWYKDEAEFFRYAFNQMQIFPVEGVSVDVRKMRKTFTPSGYKTLNVSQILTDTALESKNGDAQEHYASDEWCLPL